MNTRLEIILEVAGIRYYLDTQGVETIPLTFNIANIKDISTTQGSFSKSITIPETPNNRQVFNNISDLNSQSDFNPNRRNRAYILVDSQMIIEGYFQLTEISLDYSQNKTNMTLVIFTDNNDFYTVLGDDYIETIDLSRFDHIWNETNVKNSWTASYTNGYYYPLIDYGDDWSITDINGSGSASRVNTKDILPSIYARTIWDQIFTEAGFSWTSNSLSKDTPFDNLIIPFNSKYPTNDQNYTNKNSFIAGMSSSSASASSVQSVVLPHTVSPGTRYTTITRVKFNVDVADPNGLWDPINSQYTNTSSQPVTMRFGYDGYITQIPGSYLGPPSYTPFFQLKRSRDPLTGLTVSSSYYPILGPLGPTGSGYCEVTCATKPASPALYSAPSVSPEWNQTYLNPSVMEVLKGKWYTPSLDIYPGESVWLEYCYDLYSYTDLYTAGTTLAILNSYALTIPPTFTDYVRSTFFNEISEASGVNQTLHINSCIPKKIKKKDFILSIIKMFNLVVEPDKQYPNTLRIETRDSYYSTGTIKDWSKKIDLNDSIDVQILGETQNRRTTFRYKDDKDYLNIDYTDKTKLSYGEHTFITDNEFVTGEKKVEIVFSPTPITSLPRSISGATPSNIIIPKIGVVNNNHFTYAASNIRILQKKYVPITSNNDYWVFNSTTMSSYPYAGHLDDPFNPTLDINYGQTLGLYYPQVIVTDNNLYSKYWEKMIEEISNTDSRIITSSMYLTPQDIVDFKFSDNIFIDFGQGGQYYKVNKIDGYDPTTIRTCRVEFIKTRDITVNTTPSRSRGWTSTVFTNPVAVATNKTNMVFSANSNVLGLNNTVVDGGIVVGNNNISQSAMSMIVGNNNKSSANSFIYGNNNVALVDNAVIFGNNVIATQSGAVYINGPIILNGASFSGGLPSTLSIDNNSGTYSIIMGTSTSIKSMNGRSQIDLDFGYTQDNILLSSDNGGQAESYVFLDPATVFLKNGDGGTGRSFLQLDGNVKLSTIDLFSTDGKFNTSNARNIIFFGDSGAAAVTTQNNDKPGVVISSKNSTIDVGVMNSVILGSNGITATYSDSVYVPDLYIQDSKSISFNNNTTFKNTNAGSINIFDIKSSVGTATASIQLTSGLSTTIISTVQGPSSTTAQELSFNAGLKMTNTTTAGTGTTYQKIGAVSTTTVGTFSMSTITFMSNDQSFSIRGQANGYCASPNRNMGATFYASFIKYGGVIYQNGTTDIVLKDGYGDGTTPKVWTDGTTIFISVRTFSAKTSTFTTSYEILL